MVTILKNKIDTKKAFSLVDILIAIALISLFLTNIIFILIDSRTATTRFAQRAEKTIEIENLIEKIQLVKQDSWTNIFSTVGLGQFHIELDEAGKYVVSEGQIYFDNYSYYFESFYIQRDSNNNIVDDGGEIDPYTIRLNITIDWSDSFLENNLESFDIFINNWNTRVWSVESDEDFAEGNWNDLEIEDGNGGTIVLTKIYYPDWCNPTLFMTEHDLPGLANLRTVLAGTGYAYLGTAGETSGNPFTKVQIEGYDPPILTVESTFEGHTVNDIFVQGEYAFLATSTSDKEVIILNISSVPYTEVGYFNAPGSTRGKSVFVKDNVGYLANGRYVRSFDLSSYFGSRPQLSSKSLGWSISEVSKIYIHGNYLFASLDWDWYELAIVDVSNPSNMNITSQTSVNNQQVYDMYVSSNGNRVYFGTNNSSYEREFFIIDTTSKTGSRPKIASLDTSGTTVRGIAVIEEDDTIILVGTGGTEYKVYTYQDESNPLYCGGMQINSGIYDVSSATDGFENVFSYIVTGDSGSEFKILRGGPGIGTVDGGGYVSYGVYNSAVKDTGHSGSLFYSLEIEGVVPEDTSVRVWIRAGNNPVLNEIDWIGPDGTSDTYFSDLGYFDIRSLGVNGQYVQFKVELHSNIISTPEIDSIKLYYE